MNDEDEDEPTTTAFDDDHYRDLLIDDEIL
jgi:hypothetical protein